MVTYTKQTDEDYCDKCLRFKPVYDFIQIDNEFYLEGKRYATVEEDTDGNLEYLCEDGNTYFLDVCDIHGHEFEDEKSWVLKSGDIRKKCSTCEDVITFYHYVKAEIKKDSMSLNNLSN